MPRPKELDPARGQLNGQRYADETAADVGDDRDRGVLVRHLETGFSRARSMKRVGASNDDIPPALSIAAVTRLELQAAGFKIVLHPSQQADRTSKLLRALQPLYEPIVRNTFLVSAPIFESLQSAPNGHKGNGRRNKRNVAFNHYSEALMFHRLQVCCFTVVAVWLLGGCGGAGNVTLTPPPHAVDVPHALSVQPLLLKFTTPAARTLTVSFTSKNIVYAESSDAKIATVSPSHIDLAPTERGLGTATLTVVLHAIGEATIGLRDADGDTANIPVTVGAASKIYVTTSFCPPCDSSVMTYTSAGVRTTPTINNGLEAPVGLAVDEKSTVHVVDLDSDTVTTYNADGKRTSPTLTAANGLQSPDGIAVGPDGRIFVSNFNRKVTSYRADGTPSVPTIVDRASPLTLAIDAIGKFYVANFDGTLSTYDASGTRTAPTLTGLPAVNAVTVDVTGKIYIATPTGVETFTANGTRTTPTIYSDDALGVAVDALGTIYVADLKGIERFRQDGTSAAPTISSDGGFRAIAVR